MPAPSDFGDGATVIEGATPSHALHAHAHGAHVPHGGSTGSSRGKGVETFSPAKNSAYYRDTFAKTTDYFSEERPFVVLIGKDGVIGALRKLDEHLRNVCMNFFFLTPLTLHARLPPITNSFCWLQAGHNKIISDKVCDYDCDCNEGSIALMAHHHNSKG